MGRRMRSAVIGAVVVMGTTLGSGSALAAATATYGVGAISNVSGACAKQNAEVEQAVDPKAGYVYELWMGCNGIGFARSTNGGNGFTAPIAMPGTSSAKNAWDPAVAVGPDGRVYASFMVSRGGQYYPIVAASSDHGASFSQETALIPPDQRNWGDRDFIAVGPDGTIYVTWDYGPERSSVTYLCAATGSCAFATGDLNVVIQKSTDGGKTFGPMSYVSPGFPASGGDSAPLVVEPNGRIDVLYQGYQITNPTTYTMNPAYSYFTSSTDGGMSWSTPVRVGQQGGTMSLSEWWIDGDIGLDAGGNLYATWDTQGTNADGSANDVGWLSYSTDHGARWSAPIQAPPDQANAAHIMAVAGGGAGIAHVGWLTNSDPLGYAQDLRTFSIARGWLSAPAQISTTYGNPNVWPGDTVGISTLSPTHVVLSWGSAASATSEIYAAPVTVMLP